MLRKTIFLVMVLALMAVVNSASARYVLHYYSSFNDANSIEKLVADESGNSMKTAFAYTDGTAIAGVANGKFGGAAEFDGHTGQAMRISRNHPYSPFPKTAETSIDFSVSIWVKPTAAGSKTIIFPWTTDHGYSLRVLSGDTYAFYIYGTGANKGLNLGSLYYGSWTHLVLTYQRTKNLGGDEYEGRMFAYRDGVQIGSRNGVKYKNIPGESLLLGRRSTGGFFGEVDDFAVYGGVLSLTDIQMLYAGKVPSNSEEPITLYAAAEGVGKEHGFNPGNAMAFDDDTLWDLVRDFAAQGREVTVELAGGQYESSYLLVDLGSDENLLTIKGADDGTTVFDGGRFPLVGAVNLAYKNIHFTGTYGEDEEGVYRGGYPHYVGASETRVSRDVLIENCSWIDLTIIHGATGVHNGSNNVVYKDCVFKRVGPTSAEHMIYNAYGAKYVSIIDCEFEDCVGDYVRFRDYSPYGMVYNCSFKSTAKAYDKPFISVPGFSDTDPGKDILSNNFLFANNRFEYSGASSPSAVFTLLHKGFDPVHRNYLMDAGEGYILENGTVEERKALILNNCAVNLDEFRAVDNTYINTGLVATFSSNTAYGAVSKGWEGTVDISDLINTTDASMPSKAVVDGDVSGDGRVDIEDLQILVGKWLVDCNYSALMDASYCY